jgi:hypothetical protein
VENRETRVLLESFGWYKKITRQSNLMKGKLPAEHPRQERAGARLPVQDWLRGHLKPLLLDALNRKSGKEFGLILNLCSTGT